MIKLNQDVLRVHASAMESAAKRSNEGHLKIRLSVYCTQVKNPDTDVYELFERTNVIESLVVTAASAASISSQISYWMKEYSSELDDENYEVAITSPISSKFSFYTCDLMLHTDHSRLLLQAVERTLLTRRRMSERELYSGRFAIINSGNSFHYIGDFMPMEVVALADPGWRRHAEAGGNHGFLRITETAKPRMSVVYDGYSV